MTRGDSIDILDKIVNICNELNEVEEYDNNLSSDLSNADSRLSDLYHYIETNKLKTNQCYRIVQEMRKVLIKRRKIKNDIELMKIFHQNENKLLKGSNRPFLLNTMGRVNKNLIGSEYNNRIYTKEELEEIIGGLNDTREKINCKRDI